MLFLAEAFTRPAMMNGLGKIGFSQSYTYFTWRTSAWEMREYCEQLVASADHMRPNFWPNTPDILHETLQHGGPPMFKIRAVLASMLDAVVGHVRRLRAVRARGPPRRGGIPRQREVRAAARATGPAPRPPGRSLAGFLGRLNAIRRDNPALHWLRNLRFHDIDNPALLCWSKRDARADNTILVICSFDSSGDQWGNTTLNMPALGMDWHERFVVTDQLTGGTYDWGQRNAVRLDPFLEPAHILSVRPRR